jgi:hypothetical protein
MKCKNDDGWTTNPDYNDNFGAESDDRSITDPIYEVGYKKPPKHSQFKKGQSGNTKGRRKLLLSAVSIVRKILKGKRRISIDG